MYRGLGQGSYGGRVMVWTLSGEEVVGFKANAKNLSSIAFSPDGKTLAAVGLGGDISLWALPAGEKIGVLSGHEVAAWSLAFVHAGRFLVSFGYEGTIKFWDTESWEEARTLRPQAPGVRGLAFSLDEALIALSMEGKAQLWSVEEWALQAELPVSTKSVSSVAFAPDGRWLAVGAADKKIRVWAL